MMATIPADRHLTRCFELIATLDEGSQRAVCRLVNQLARSDDPDAFETFVRWRDDAHMETLMLLAAKLTASQLDDLIGEAEKMIEAEGGTVFDAPVRRAR